MYIYADVYLCCTYFLYLIQKKWFCLQIKKLTFTTIKQILQYSISYQAMNCLILSAFTSWLNIADTSCWNKEALFQFLNIIIKHIFILNIRISFIQLLINTLSNMITTILKLLTHNMASSCLCTFLQLL